MRSKGSPSKGPQSLFYMPSFYGALAWGFWLIVYFSRVISWEADDPITIMIYCIVELAFIGSILTFGRHYRAWLGGHLRLQEIERGDRLHIRFFKSLIVILHAGGFYGVYQYAQDFGAAFSVGGLGGFWDQTMNQAWRTRWEAEYTTSLGTQLGYLGWIAVGITVFEVTRGRISRWWLVPAIVQFAGNLLWVGRMRPFTILFASALMAVVALRAPRFGMVVKWGTLVLSGMLILFWSVAVWVGKLGPWTGFDLPNVQKVLENIALYGTGSFAYFNQMLVHGVYHGSPLENTLYPFFKVLAVFKLAPEPLSQIRQFMSMPFFTNVSTFLDPFYRDGGIPLLFVGIIVQSFGADALAVSLLRYRNAISYFGWTAVCFTSFMTFFTYKICEFPTWLFVALGLMAGMSKSLIRSEVKRLPVLKHPMEHSSIQHKIPFRQAAIRTKR